MFVGLRPLATSQAQAHSGYKFRPLSLDERIRQTAGQSLVIWVTGPEATGPEATAAADIAERSALRATSLIPLVFTISDYLDRLTEQARGASVSTLNAVPVVLLPTEREAMKTWRSFAGFTEPNAYQASQLYELAFPKRTYAWSVSCDMTSQS